ncbi:MAG TPA: tetratricopeptide repeat protein [bacterium]|nr:tetratricopeptide repeat protein [bacterium]
MKKRGKVRSVVMTTLSSVVVLVVALLLVWVFFLHKGGPFNYFLRPKSFEFNHKMEQADLYYFASEFATATPMFEELVEMRPDNAIAHGKLGVSYAKTGKVEKALEHLDKAVELDPQFHEAFANKAAIHQSLARQKKELMDFPGAREQYLMAEMSIEKALEIKPKTSRYLEMQGEIVSEQREMPE